MRKLLPTATPAELQKCSCEYLDIGSRWVSTTVLGSPHDHKKCSLAFQQESKVNHLATPINPKATGRKINIGGEGETNYLGFEDFVTEERLIRGPTNRPLTTTLAEACASDICFRSAPITDSVRREIIRIAQTGCRLTYASNPQMMISVTSFLVSIGKVIDYVVLSDKLQPDGLGLSILVIETL